MRSRAAWLAGGFAVSLVVAGLVWVTNTRAMAAEVTRKETDRLYAVLLEKGVDRTTLSWVPAATLRRLDEIEHEFGSLKSYRLDHTFVQVLGTPSGAAVDAVRTKGRTREEVYVDAIRPRHRIWFVGAAARQVDSD